MVMAANEPCAELGNELEGTVSASDRKKNDDRSHTDRSDWMESHMLGHDLRQFEVTEEGCQMELRVKSGAVTVFVARRGDRNRLGDPTLIYKNILVSEIQLLDNSWVIELVVIPGSSTM